MALDLSEITAFAHELADASGAVCRQYFRGQFELDDKSDASPVTSADKGAERVLRQMIGERFPDHGIFGEEEGVEGLDRPYVWVLDPIDGTRAFATGLPVYGTLIALMHEGKPIFGLCDMPSLDERYASTQARQTVSTVSSLAQARLRYTSHQIFSAEDWPAIQELEASCRFLHPGGDCYNYCLLAEGHCDLVVEAGLQPYDFLALEPIVRAAGGIMTDWQGQPLTLESEGKVVAAATDALHQQTLTILNRKQNHV